MDYNRRSVLLFCLGAIGGAGTIFTVVYFRKLLRKTCTKVSMEQLTNAISLSTLRKLSQVPNVSIRLCAFDILTTRALRPQCLQFIIQYCYTDNEENVLKACTILEGFTKNPKFREKIIHFGGLEALSHAIYRSWVKKNDIFTEEDGRIQRLACMAIFDLISVQSGDGEQTDINFGPKIRLVDKNPSFIPTILGIMKETEDRELEKWGLYLIHQIAIWECTREKLKDHWEVVEVISKLIMKNQGESVHLRLAFQVLVTLVNVLMANDEENVLQEIRKFGGIRPAIACFKSDNRELVYWAVGLIHEFAINNVAIEEICSVPILLKSLYSVLVSSEAAVQRLVLRVLRYLSESSEEFKLAVIHYKQLLARLPICLASGDEDLVSWSLFLIHDIAKTGAEAIELLLQHSKGVIEALVELSTKNACAQDANTTCRYIAETLGFFCCLENIHYGVVKAGALKAVLAFAMMDDVDVKFWSTSLLLNLSMSADVLKEEIVKEGGIRILIDLAVSDTDEPQIAMQAAKTLIMLGFIETCFHVHLRSSGYKSSCSAIVNGIEYSPNKLGINLIVVDPMTLTVVETEAFHTGHDTSASSKLTQFIKTLPVMSLVFAVVRGEANFFLTDEAKSALAELGLTGYEYNTGELWVLSGQRRLSGQESLGAVEFKHGYDAVELKVQIPQGYYVNEQVEVLIMAPLLDILMSTPPESNISKVSELELLTILARHDSHRKVMLRKAGFLEYMAKLIWNTGSRSLSDLRSNPMLVAHCIGAMKTISGLVLSEGAVARCLQYGVIKEVIRLLFCINDAIIRAEKEQKMELKNQMNATTNSDLSFLSGNFPHEVEEKVPFSSVHDSTTAHQGKDTMDDTLSEGVPFTYEDFEEAFISLTQLSVTILYHCSKLDLAEDSLYTALSVHVLWCTLLTCRDQLRRAIAIPVENIITRCCGNRKYPLVINPERPPVCLDRKEMTGALMLSSDRSEVINFNWTFESVHATHAVGRTRHSHGAKPTGWYYEVQIKTPGIMQIGWRTSACKYGPEKGVGVGDDVHSCAFDGARMKVWNGPACRQFDNDYGKKWAVNDIVSCLFSWDGEVSFWLNGENLGVAFENMNPEIEHYPGASLAMDQHCCFNFGGEKPFRYWMPEGYIGVNDVVGKRVYSRRPRSKSYTKGSFESIAEEDEESSEDVKNIHISRLQRCCSSEPSLRKNDGNKQRQSLSSVDERRRFSSSTSSYNTERPSTPNSSHVSTPSTPFTPITPLSPFWSPVFSHQSPDLFSSIPWLYFEAEVSESAYRARNVGYFHAKSGNSSSCEFHESQNMSFPSQNVESFSLVRAPSVIGCGLLWPEGVFFTLDGVFSNKSDVLPDDDIEAGNVLAYVTCPQVKVNYGQEQFLFKQANVLEERLSAAQLLHSFSRQLLQKLA